MSSECEDIVDYISLRATDRPRGISHQSPNLEVGRAPLGGNTTSPLEIYISINSPHDGAEPGTYGCGCVEQEASSLVYGFVTSRFDLTPDADFRRLLRWVCAGSKRLPRSVSVLPDKMGRARPRIAVSPPYLIWADRNFLGVMATSGISAISATHRGPRRIASGEVRTTGAAVESRGKCHVAVLDNAENPLSDWSAFRIVSFRPDSRRRDTIIVRGGYGSPR